MKKIKFIIFTALTFAIILPSKISLANEEVKTNSDYLGGIEQRNISDLENLTPEGYKENAIIKDSLPINNMNLEIKEDNSNFLNSNSTDDTNEKLNSNHGDKTPIGGSIPFLDF